MYNIEYGWDKFRDFWTIVSIASHGKTHAGKRMQVRSLSEHSNSYEFCSDMPKVGLTQRARKLIARGVFIIWDKIRDFWTIVSTTSLGKTHAGSVLSEHSESYEIQLTLTYHRSNSGFRFSPCARATEEEPAATVVFAQWSKYHKPKKYWSWL